MARRQPEGPELVAPVQRIRLQYAKRGRLRFCSHRDFARAFERSLRRAEVPMSYSAGFHPHPRISYVGAAPTGVGSEAEYLEIGLARRCEPEQVRAALDAVLPEGLDVVRAVDVEDCRPGSLAEQMHASVWRIELAAEPAALAHAVARLLAAESVPVDRLTKDGLRSLDARARDRGRRGVGRRRERPSCDTGRGRPSGHPDGSARRCAHSSAGRRRFRPVAAPSGHPTGAGTGR